MKGNKISDGRINFPLLKSDELVTEFTIPAERHTEHLSGIPIDTNLSSMVTNLRTGECMEKSMEMMHLVNCINKRAVELLNGFIDFKESILKKVESCRLFSFNYLMMVRIIE